jgi:serine/threonine-protein kinase
MLYCLLTGQPPFLGQSLVELVQAKEVGTFRPARRSNPDVPDRLDLIIHKMTAKLPQHRYASCAEVIRDLESLELTNKCLAFLSSRQPSTTSTEADLSGQATKLDVERTSTPRPVDRETEPDVWYIRYRTSAGQKILRKMTLEQVHKLIEDEDFDPKAQGSRRPKDGFRALATYREFESVLVPRVTRAAADTRGSKLRNLYEKLSDEEKAEVDRKTRSSEEKPPPFWMQKPQEIPAILLGRLLLFIQDRIKKGWKANLPLILAGLAMLIILLCLIAMQMGFLG